jgi:uncharacterized protein with von Willebrand factor type A (vWA) domain
MGEEEPSVIKDLVRRARLAESVDKGVWDMVRRAFPGVEFDAWSDALQRLFDSGIGANGIAAFVRASPPCAHMVGGTAAVAMANAANLVMRRAGVRAAVNLLSAAPTAARRLRDGPAFGRWLAVLEHLAAAAPESVDAVIDRTDIVLGRLDPGGFQAWALAGLRSAGDDPERRLAYFTLSDPGALRVVEQEASDVVLGVVERSLKAYLAALWRLRPLIRPAAPKMSAMHVPRRSSFDALLIRLPETYPGFVGQQARRLFRAAVAHIGAHMIYTSERFPVGTLKPIQIALVSLIEDARVEALAGRDFPGLMRLWRSFHVAEPHSALVAEPLMARLSRALIDPDYKDDDPWVNKGKMMFFDARPKWDDPQISRTIGGLLGNDLGQMRIQFNPKSYVVEPTYRDDNLGIWEFGQPHSAPAEDADVIYDSVRIEQTEDEDRPHQRRRAEESHDQANRAARVRAVEQDTGIPLARYPEWDHAAGRERPDWTQIVEFEPPTASGESIDRVLAEYPEVLNRITKLIRSAKVSRATRVRRQPEGDRLDLEASIRAVIDRRMGHAPDPRVYEASMLKNRDLAVLLLLDISESTKDPIKGTTTSVISIERAATGLLAHAMAGLGDPFAIHAFCSNGRSEVRYFRIKDFEGSYGEAAKARLAGLRGGLSTRMGAALRHAGAEIKGQLTHRRLILIVSDGEPSDIDVSDRKYLVEDARKAVQGLAHDGIDVFCVGLDSGGESYLTRIFGRRNVLQIDRVAALPEKLPMLYFRLTA